MTDSVRARDESEPGPFKRLVFIALIGLLPAVLCWLALETAIWFLYHHVNLFPFARENPISIAFRQLDRSYRPMLQWDPACSFYNEAIGNFTLRPGRCTHATAEFSVDVEANSMGLRDTEADLRAPEVILIGPSFAAGWGVAQDQTMAGVVEKTTGLRVLNAGIAGYGLRQSLALLSRLDRSRMRYLVVVFFVTQDARGDREILELKEPVTSYRLPRESYEQAVAKYTSRPADLAFGKYLYKLTESYLAVDQQRWQFERQDERLRLLDFPFSEVARQFFEVMDLVRPLLGDSTIIFVPSLPACQHGADLLSAAIDEAAAKGFKHVSNPVIAVRVDAEIDSSYCFVFDNHLNTRAHALFGERISSAIRRDGMLRDERSAGTR